MLTVLRKELLSKMEPAAKVAVSRTPKEILKWVRLTHDGTGLTIAAWDGEVGIRLKLACEGKPCDFLLPAAHAVAVLKAFTSEKVTLDPQESRTHLQGNREKFAFPVMSAAEFQVWEHSGDEFTLSAAAFNPAVKRSKWAADETSLRNCFNGIYLDNKHGCVVATDSKCLCAEKICEPSPCPSGVMPLKLVDIASTVLGGDIRCSMSAGRVELSDGNTSVFGMLVQGRFPAWKSIPDSVKPDAELDISVGELLRVTRQAMLASDVERQSIDLKLSAGTLSVSSGSSGRGDSSVEVPVASDAESKVTFDGTFLAGMLAGLDPLEIVHWCISTNGPNKFTLRNWTGVIMPMAER